MLNLNTVNRLTSGATVDTTVKLVVGTKKDSNVYASFTVKGTRLLTLEDIVSHLRSPAFQTTDDGKPRSIAIRLPRIDLSTRISVTLKTLYAPLTLADVLEGMAREAPVEPKADEPKAEIVLKAANSPVDDGAAPLTGDTSSPDFVGPVQPAAKSRKAKSK